MSRRPRRRQGDAVQETWRGAGAREGGGAERDGRSGAWNTHVVRWRALLIRTRRLS